MEFTDRNMETEVEKCKITARELCLDMNCKNCNSRRFYFHRFARFYSMKNEQNLLKVTLNTYYEYIFDCPDCNKEWTKKICIISQLDEKSTFCDDCNKKKLLERNKLKKENKVIDKSTSKYGCKSSDIKLCVYKDCNKCNVKRLSNHVLSRFYNKELNKEDIFMISINSTKKIYLYCDICKHNTLKSLNEILRNKDMKFCRYCTNELLCGDKDCLHCWNRSFASHEKSKYWSEKNEKNPWDVHKGVSRIKYLLKCDKCTHEYWARLSHITNPNEESGCPYCHTESLCKNIECQICFKLSFASCEKSKYWSLKNKDKPHEVRLGSNLFYLFDCDICKHEFEMQPCRITDIKKLTWCPYCVSRALCFEEDCKHCFERSFASMYQSRFWSTKNGDLTPRMIFKKTSKKYIFDCLDCKRDYEQRPADIYFHNNGCSNCLLKTEKLVLLYVDDNTEHIIKRNIKFDWCFNPNTCKYLPFDLVIEDLKLIIEIDGDQHFRFVQCFDNDVERNQNRDLYKMKLALENGYSIIRIVQKGVYYNLFDWKPLLINAIKKYEKPQVIFIDYKSEYDIYKEKIKSIDSVTLDSELDECEEVFDDEE